MHHTERVCFHGSLSSPQGHIEPGVTHTHTHTHTQSPFILYIENDKRKARAMFSDQMKIKASHLHRVNYECVFGLPTSAPNRKTSSCIPSKIRVRISFLCGDGGYKCHVLHWTRYHIHIHTLDQYLTSLVKSY